ncbi:hypothetical protein [Kitasatospora sp. NPDC048407]|uniref:hypothetical protein n=1 Tax=Kitasatospora sp. NPDC048407 TaxID=3364051 RepID=UPI00371227E4
MALSVAREGSLCRLAEVVQQVPAVRDLDGLRFSDGGALGEERCAAPARDLDARQQA